MSFGVIQFTNRGRALQAKALTGVQINFTRIAVGDGQLSGQVIAELNALINEVKSITLNKLKTLPGGKAEVGGILSNQDLSSGFYWRELGVFAQDPDLGEILYCYGNAGDLAEYIPGPSGSEILERQVNVITVVGDASNVSATIDQSLIYATQQDIDEAILTHEQKNNPHGITPGNIGAETPAGAQEKADGAKATANAYTDSVFGGLAGTGRTTETVKGNADAIASVQSNLQNHTEGTNPHNITATLIGAETPSGAQAKADAAEAAALASANAYTDQEVGVVNDSLMSHMNDNVKHITSTERTTWNSKADGNHNHDGIYEPVLLAEQKRKITFGTVEPVGGSDGDIYFQYE